MRKTIKLFGKTISTTVMAFVVMAGLASAALLTYYGTITAQVNVQQSILLDGLAWPLSQVTDTISEAAPGGETFCFEHKLTNQMSVSGTVNFEDSCSKDGNPDNCGGITKTYYNSFDKVGPFNSQAQPGVPGDFAHGNIYKEDLSEAIKWTFTITDISPHYGVGLVIDSNNDGTPDYQIYFAEFGDQLWHYQPYGATCWSGADTTTLPAGVIVTGSAAGNVFTITIPKSMLGGIGSQFGWMSQVRTLLLGVYPGWTPWCGPFLWETESTIGSLLTPPVIIPTDTTKDFYICYGFAPAIAPGTYTITTGITP